MRSGRRGDRRSPGPGRLASSSAAASANSRLRQSDNYDALSDSAAAAASTESLKAAKGAKVHTLTVPSVKSTTEESVETTLTVTSTRIQKYGTVGKAYSKHWMTGVLLEPHVAATFTSSSDGEAAHWKVVRVAKDGNIATEYESTADEASLTYTFTHIGEYHVSRKRSAAAANEGEEAEVGMVFVRYVRREVRALTVSDREALFGAWENIIRVKDLKTGQGLYGKNFLPMTRLMTLHNNLAGAKDCDHLHDGMATGHVQIPQCSRPRCRPLRPCLCRTGSTPSTWRTSWRTRTTTFRSGRSSRFSDKFFGTTDLSTATIKTGHFKDLSVTPWENVGAVSNSFGLIRAPWNNLDVRKPCGTSAPARTWTLWRLPPAQLLSSCANLESTLLIHVATTSRRRSPNRRTALSTSSQAGSQARRT